MENTRNVNATQVSAYSYIDAGGLPCRTGDENLSYSRQPQRSHLRRSMTTDDSVSARRQALHRDI